MHVFPLEWKKIARVMCAFPEHLDHMAKTHPTADLWLFGRFLP
jgi:hypothetical protein